MAITQPGRGRKPLQPFSDPPWGRKAALRVMGSQSPFAGRSLQEKIHSEVQSEVTFRPMFKEALQGVVDSTEGGLAGLVMDFEGIPLESYAKDGQATDIEVVGAEVSVVVKAIQRATEMLDAGETREVAFKSDKLVTLIRIINKDYFVAMTLHPDGNFGKGRFLLRLVAPKLREELEI